MTEEIQEPFSVSEMYCDGSGEHFVIGETLKFVLWSWQKIPGIAGVHRVAVLKVSRPITGITESMMKTQAAVRGQAFKPSDSGFIMPSAH